MDATAPRQKTLHAPLWPMFRRVERQVRLFGRMMERLNVDPGAAAREGHGEGFAAASRRCLCCTHSAECRDWLDRLKERAQAEGLWNLFLPGLRDDEPGTRLTNLEYAPLAEMMGRIPWSSEVFNCGAPDTGNMELLHLCATPEQRERWLVPLLRGQIRSCIGITEPDTASSDPTNLQTTIRREGGEYVVNFLDLGTRAALCGRAGRGAPADGCTR